jgi:hypothetical protein
LWSVFDFWFLIFDQSPGLANDLELEHAVDYVT